MNKNTKIIELKGVGEKTARLFQKLPVETAAELLNYYPRSYDKFDIVRSISEVGNGEPVTVRAILTAAPTVKKVRSLTVANAVVRDATGVLQLTFFNMPYLKSVLKSGIFYCFRGIIQVKDGRQVMEQPRIYRPEEYTELAGTLQPRYALTAGLTNNMLIKAMKQTLSRLWQEEDHLPGEILQEFSLCGWQEAMESIHFPDSVEMLVKARKRLVFDEFLRFLLTLNRLKEHAEEVPAKYVLKEKPDTDMLIASLPYELTGAQKKVFCEIRTDLTGGTAMNRLIQGDVGSGKTILAFLALLMTTANGLQGCLMAPTEVLARQHYDSMTGMAEKYRLPVRPVLLTGSMTAKEKRNSYEKIQTGYANVVIGTHALLQEKVSYHSLALVITDEQHRFGVRQRETLAGKGENVHVLVMSATPIPRTLAIILYGDLAVSVLDELPADRLPIKNCVVGTDFREKAYRFICKEAAAGRQVYVICPMVEEGEMDGAENVTDYAEKLRAALPAELRIAILHGKMKPAQKETVMEAFSAGEIDVLVATTVIEVGINVPNATVMMVENAERFGLAQLHQLRGRVGRGDQQSYCIFITSSDSRQSRERLEILNHSNDGFQIANEDLRLRGPGDLFGIRQSGLMEFAIGDIYQDADLLMQTSTLAERIRREDPDETADQYQALYRRLDAPEGNAVDFRSI